MTRGASPTDLPYDDRLRLLAECGEVRRGEVIASLAPVTEPPRLFFRLRNSLLQLRARSTAYPDSLNGWVRRESQKILRCAERQNNFRSLGSCSNIEMRVPVKFLMKFEVSFRVYCESRPAEGEDDLVSASFPAANPNRPRQWFKNHVLVLSM